MSACAKSGHSGRFWILLLAGKGAQVRGASPVKLPRRTFLHLAAGAATLPAMPRITWAQAYPTRPVTLVVPIAAGGGLDTAARILAEKLQDKFQQPFIVENRPGAGTTVGTNFVAKAKPDGRTIARTT